MTQHLKTYTLAELAKRTGANIHGNADCQITGIASLQEAQSGQITFLANAIYRKFLPSTQASAIILAPADLEFCQTNALIVADPYAAFAKITHCFAPETQLTGSVHPTAIIGKNVTIPASCTIAAQVVIGDNVVLGENTVIGAGSIIGENSQIGANCFLYPRVTIYHSITIGNRVTLHSGAVVGSDGFGFAFDRQQNSWIKIYHSGSVRIEDDVEIGANTTIDRGVFGNTVIERQAKIDNLVQIAHNVHIGAYTVIAGCVGIAGSARIGKYCRVGGAAAINGHIEIADNITISGMSMVTHSLSEPGSAHSSGTGIMENGLWRRSVIRFQHLDELAKKVKRLEKICDVEVQSNKT